MVKAFLQIVPILDALAGVASIRAVAALSGKGGDIAIFLATLLCGLIAIGMAFGIGVVLVGLDSMFSKHRDAQFARWRRDRGFD